MKEFTLEHKYCGMIRVIVGYDIYSAARKNNINLKYWVEKK